MKKKLLSLALALAMCLGLLPVTALAAESNLPDWYFLCVIFKNTDADYEEDGIQKHVKKDLSAEDIQIHRDQIKKFEDFMTESGVMTPHVDIVEIDTPIKELKSSTVGPYPTAEYLAPILKSKGIDLDQYDHVTVFANLETVKTTYWAVTAASRPFENGTTYSFVKSNSFLSFAASQTPLRSTYGIVHEFLHTMERKCGYSFDLHAIEDDIVPGYQTDEKYKACMLDVMRNRINGEHGSGVLPSAWLYSARTLRAIRELTISSDVATIGGYQFARCINLEKVIIPSTVVSIKDHAFQFCTSLTEVTLPASISTIEEGTFEQCTALTEITIPSGVTSIGVWAFESCMSLKKITIPASVTSIGETAFYHTGIEDVYYEGTEDQWKAIKIGKYNSLLTNAAIHYNSPMPEQPATPAAPTSTFTDVPADAYYAEAVSWAIEKGITTGTSATTFSPDETCTQGQILTFLWRGAGSPDPAGTVIGSEYYATALQWAKEQGITGELVNPDSFCRRDTAVLFMWRYAGQPKYDPKTLPFTDVHTNTIAIAWALDNHVTTGTSATTFSPSQTCTRGQIVTFLYRAFAK